MMVSKSFKILTFELIDVFCINFVMHVIFNFVHELNGLSNVLIVLFLLLLIYAGFNTGIILASIFLKHV